MSAITTLSDEEVTPHVAEIFAGAKASMGKVPNLFRVLAHVPAALDVYTGSKRFLHDGVLSQQAQEQIAIAIAAANGCDYCLAAHTGAARAVGVSAEDRASAQRGHTSDGKVQAVLDLALAINATHGHPFVTDPDSPVLKGAIGITAAIFVLGLATQVFHLARHGDRAR